MSDVGGGTVLAVDDEPMVLNLVNSILARHGFRVMTAESGETALQICRESAGVDLLLADVVMPAMSGPELAECLTAQNPHIRVLFMSGFDGGHLFRYGALSRGFKTIRKPFLPNELIEAVNDTLADRS